VTLTFIYPFRLSERNHPASCMKLWDLPQLHAAWDIADGEICAGIRDNVIEEES
jgi:hypothetical protein